VRGILQKRIGSNSLRCTKSNYIIYFKHLKSFMYRKIISQYFENQINYSLSKLACCKTFISFCCYADLQYLDIIHFITLLFHLNWSFQHSVGLAACPRSSFIAPKMTKVSKCSCHVPGSKWQNIYNSTRVKYEWNLWTICVLNALWSTVHE